MPKWYDSTCVMPVEPYLSGGLGRGNRTDRQLRQYLQMHHHRYRYSEYVIYRVSVSDRLAEHHMFIFGFWQQYAYRLDDTGIIIDLIDTLPPSADAMSVMPCQTHDLVLHIYQPSFFLSIQKTGACMVIPLFGTTMARACCGCSNEKLLT